MHDFVPQRALEQEKNHLFSFSSTPLKYIFPLQSAQNTRPENMCDLPDFVLRCRCSRSYYATIPRTATFFVSASIELLSFLKLTKQEAGIKPKITRAMPLRDSLLDLMPALLLRIH